MQELAVAQKGLEDL
jgi:hypothetical protein